ncbi:hypothetical protein ACFQPA_17465 [Halomarina halobia]|uniref:Uncharacterized protein n=1 Tax=Halomarina halobia TaxID=3033386 RepID=A0ABD6AE39_9EURY|nr:hypothetical protein [Halomarina sp. PSR21]
MWNPDPKSLPDWIEHAYELLAARIDGRRGGFPRERAYELLLADEGFVDEPADVRYAVDHLLNQGWLYEADGELRITDPEH